MTTHIPKSYIEELLDKTNIIDVIDPLVSLTKKGNNYTACCPFHQEKTPSFNVSVEKQFFHCFGCQKSGNVITFIIEYKKLSFVESIKFLSHLAGLSIPTSHTKSFKKDNKNIFDILNLVSKFYQQQLRQTNLSKDAINSLKNRGISGATAKKFKIGFAPNGWDYTKKHLNKINADNNTAIELGVLVQKNSNTYDRFRNRIIFPITNIHGNVVGFGGRVINNDEQPKYLNSSDSPAFSKSNVVYGLYEVIKHYGYRIPSIILVEGYTDVIQLYENGVCNAVATLGTATTKNHIEMLFKYTDSLVFCYDGDTSGKNAAWKAVINSLPSLRQGKSISLVFLPDELDPDNYIRKYGKNKFIELTNNPTTFEKYFFNELSKDLSIENINGKSQLISRATPLIAQIPYEPTVSLMNNYLSRLTNLEIHNINKYNNKLQSNRNYETLSKFHIVIAIILQHPLIVSEIDKNLILELSKFPKLIFIKELIEKVQTSSLAVGVLLEEWRDNSEKFKLLNKLLSSKLEIPMEGLHDELCERIRSLIHNVNSSDIHKLLFKGRMQNLTMEEKSELQRLILQQKT